MSFRNSLCSELQQGGNGVVVGDVGNGGVAVCYRAET